MKTLFLAGFVTVASALVAQQSPSGHMETQVGVGGTYKVEGTNPSGAAYEGTVVITGDAANGYQFKWTIAGDSFDGTGTLEGDTLTVDWGAPDPVIYKVKDGGAKLKGKWGAQGKGKEKLTRQ